MEKKRVAVILANLGTPDAPTTAAVRIFLKQFLSDQRVIEMPKWLWQIILRAFILPFRPKKVAHNYQSIWQDDSPMRSILNRQVALVNQALQSQYPHLDITVMPAMSYGNPNIADVLRQIGTQMPDQLIVLPLFPQYSATSTAPIYDAVARWIPKQRHLPAIQIIRDYHIHPDYIQALAASVNDFQRTHGCAEKLLLSFHGIPQSYADKGDPYPQRCQQTAQHLAQALGLQDHQWAMSYQSRFGRQEWVKPYTSELLQQWAKEGVQSVHILSPAFSADCLETLEELAVENKQIFLQAGGKSYEYIPALNSRAEHIQLILNLLQAHLTIN